MQTEDLKKEVRARYGAIAEGKVPSCCGDASDGGGCGSGGLGYDQVVLDQLPEGSDLGLGCGNPTALASIQEGDVVLDLGSGAGIDCFIAARRVGPSGRVIGVDMTAQMLEKARANAEKGDYQNVEFRLGELEHLPVADQSVDLIISNCVINLVPDKAQVFREVFRVLKPGGRVMFSDIVLTGPLPEALASNLLAYVGCVAGAIERDAYASLMSSAGLTDIEIKQENSGLVSLWLESEASVPVLEQTGLSAETVREQGERIISARISASRPTH